MIYKTTRYKNICKEGSTYRVRIMRKGVRYSRSFNKLSQALSFRKEIVSI